MKLIESGQEIRFIDVDSDRVPCSLLVKLTDRTYRMTFAYNETADFFTVSLEISNSGGNTPLAKCFATASHCLKPSTTNATRCR
mgnify:CR=1 FL=1